MVFRLALVAALAAFAGCAPRATAYHFRAPLVSSVRAQGLPAPSAPPSAPPSSIPQTARIQSLPAPHKSGPSMASQQTARAAIRRIQVPLPRADDDRREPHHQHDHVREQGSQSEQPAPAEQTMVEFLRSMVGQREKNATDTQVALAALTAIGTKLDDKVAQVESGTALLELAEQRQALSQELPLMGDLVIFDRMVDGEPAPLVAVVVTTHARSLGGRDVRTIEILYLGHTVIRRGYVTPAVPTQKRDDAGRILNTFLHHTNEVPSAEHALLAGERLRAVVRADRLGSPGSLGRQSAPLTSRSGTLCAGCARVRPAR